MKLILYPIGGLANRMRAIDSAKNLLRTNSKLKVWWVKDVGLNANFSSIFDEQDEIWDRDLPRCVKKFLKLYDEKHKLVLLLLILLEKLYLFLFLDEYTCLDKKKITKAHQYLFCFIRTWEAFYPQNSFRKDLFHIKDKKTLNKELTKINTNTIGVHIRRTDNEWAIKNSPLHLFEKRMQEELKKNPQTNFYLCSDDEATKKKFTNEVWRDCVSFPEGRITRDSKEGVQQAAIEMYTLSQTTKILGSYWSSFGEIAAKLGDIDIEICANSHS